MKILIEEVSNEPYLMELLIHNQCPVKKCKTNMN